MKRISLPVTPNLTSSEQTIAFYDSPVKVGDEFNIILESNAATNNAATLRTYDDMYVRFIGKSPMFSLDEAQMIYSAQQDPSNYLLSSSTTTATSMMKRSFKYTFQAIRSTPQPTSITFVYGVMGTRKVTYTVMLK